jgi:uncharacterized repeat protein (TIGR02543 family)
VDELKDASGATIANYEIKWFYNKTLTQPVDMEDDVLTAPTRLYGEVVGRQYDITYNVGVGERIDGLPDAYRYGTGVAAIAGLNHIIGYNFEGWYDNAGFSGDPVVAIGVTETGNKTLYAKYVPAEYKAYYMGIEGNSEGVGEWETYTYNSAFTLPSALTFADGGVFAGWYGNAELTGTPVTQIAAGTYGAQDFWAKVTYAITYNLDGGTNHANNASLYIRGAGLTLGAASKDGFVFAGWYETAEFTGSAVTAVSASASGVKTLYARFATPPASYSITYVLDGGTNHADNAASYTEGVGLTLKSPAKSGYTFGGWYDNAGFTGSAVTSVSASASGDKTLYAKFTPASSSATTYNITYELNGGTNHADNAAVYTKGVGLTLKNPAKDGFTFNGWYETADFTGDAVTAVTATDSGNKTLYAKFTQNKKSGCGSAASVPSSGAFGGAAVIMLSLAFLAALILRNKRIAA